MIISPTIGKGMVWAPSPKSSLPSRVRKQDKTLAMTVVIGGEGNIRGQIKGILLPEEFNEKIKHLLRQAEAGR